MRSHCSFGRTLTRALQARLWRCHGQVEGNIKWGRAWRSMLRVCSAPTRRPTQSCQIWDLKSGTLKQQMDCGGYVYSVCFAKYNVVASGDQHKHARLWDTETGAFCWLFAGYMPACIFCSQWCLSSLCTHQMICRRANLLLAPHGQGEQCGDFA